MAYVYNGREQLKNGKTTAVQGVCDREDLMEDVTTGDWKIKGRPIFVKKEQLTHINEKEASKSLII